MHRNTCRSVLFPPFTQMPCQRKPTGRPFHLLGTLHLLHGGPAGGGCQLQVAVGAQVYTKVGQDGQPRQPGRRAAPENGTGWRAAAPCHCPGPAGRHNSRRGDDAQVRLDAQPQPGLWDKRQRQVSHLDGADLVPAREETRALGAQHGLRCEPRLLLQRNTECPWGLCPAETNRCPEGGTGAAAVRPQRRSRELASKWIFKTSRLIPRRIFAFCVGAQSAPGAPTGPRGAVAKPG